MNDTLNENELAISEFLNDLQINFNIPLVQVKDEYFPDFLSEMLNKYISFYDKAIKHNVLASLKLNSKKNGYLRWKIKQLSESLNDTIKYYYKGQVLNATITFNSSLQFINYEKSFERKLLKESIKFYRARKQSDHHFTKDELFHIKFEERHKVSTNRFSIPGLPALYLGGSSYVCWEELGRFDFQKLWFSQFSNPSQIKLIKIQRPHDFLNDLKNIPFELHPSVVLYYLNLFPLTIASTIKTNNSIANFKPEYIIPQLLMQYVTNMKSIDGIMFPSTIVDYSKISKVDAYNYVFPVKSSLKMGHCSKLAQLFTLTEPTSLELEELTYNPYSKELTFADDMPDDGKTIEIISGNPKSYSNSAFGKIEAILEKMNPSKLEIDSGSKAKDGIGRTVPVKKRSINTKHKPERSI